MTTKQDRLIDSTSRRNMNLFISPFKFAHKLGHFTVMKSGGQSLKNNRLHFKNLTQYVPLNQLTDIKDMLYMTKLDVNCLRWRLDK